MSAFSAPPINPNLDSSNLEQLKSEAVALEGSKKHEEALAKYEEVLVIQQRDLPVGDNDTHETLTSIDRCIDQLKYASVDNGDVAKSAHSLYKEGNGKDAYSLLEQTHQRQLVTHGAEHPSTLITRFNMALALCGQQRHFDAFGMFEQVLEKQTRVLPLDDPETLKTISNIAATLTQLKRHDESLKMYEDVVPKLICVIGENHNETLNAMVSMSTAQFSLYRYDDSRQTATRGLLIARRVGNEKVAARFVDILSALEMFEEDEVFAATASDEQKELRDKINQRKWAKEDAANAALLATHAKATTEDDLDALMAECSDSRKVTNAVGGRGRRRRVEEARRRRRRRRGNEM
jgi:tetratricopeptide (TPR) repeat protein